MTSNRFCPLNVRFRYIVHTKVNLNGTIGERSGEFYDLGPENCETTTVASRLLALQNRNFIFMARHDRRETSLIVEKRSSNVLRAVDKPRLLKVE